MPTKKEILKWYAQFKEMLSKEGIDHNNPADLLRIKAFKAADLDKGIRGEVYYPLDSQNAYKEYTKEKVEEFRKISDGIKGKTSDVYELSEKIEEAMQDEKAYKNLANLYLDYDKSVEEVSKNLVKYDTYKVAHFGNYAQKMFDALKLPDETNENDFAAIEKLYNFAAEGMLTIEPANTEPDRFRLIMTDVNDNLVLSEEAGTLMDMNNDLDFVPSSEQKEMLKSMGAIKHASEQEFYVVDGKEVDEIFMIERNQFLNSLKENSRNTDIIKDGQIDIGAVLQNTVAKDVNDFNDIVQKDLQKRSDFQEKYNQATDKEMEKLIEKAKYQGEKMRELEKYADKNADYSELEHENTKAKQMMKELVLEYKQYIGNDPELDKIINTVEKYANVDAHAGKNFREEREYVETAMQMLDKYFEKLDKDEESVNREIHDFLAKVKDEKNMTDEEKKQDAMLCAKMEMIDNRRRVHASLSNYFEQLVNGNLQVPYDDKIETANETPYGMVDTLEFKYINGAGVKVKQTVNPSEVGEVGSTLATALLTTTAKKKDRPVFQHEPRMNDIQQGMLGNCYMLAGLQEVARLYPWKIKECIRDNNDGTATVRLFTKTAGGYKPLYVRVDKQESRVLGLNQGNEDCLWATLIERAYTISGMHLYSDIADKTGKLMSYPGKQAMEFDANEYNEDPENYDISENPWLKIKNGVADPNWEPDISQIEGGSGGEFLEALLGGDFKNYEYSMSSLQSPLWLRVYNADYNDPEDILKLAIMNNTKDVDQEKLEGACNMSFDEIIAKELTGEDFANYNFDKNEIKEMTAMFKSVLQDVKASIQKDLDSNGGKLTGACLKEIIQLGKPFYDAASDIKLDDRTVFKNYAVSDLFTKVRNSILPLVKGAEVLKNNREAEFKKIEDKLSKGLPITIGSKHSDYINIMGGHEYSVIGAYKTDDNPPRNFLRIRNPWGNRNYRVGHGTLPAIAAKDYMNQNGLEYYTGKNGKEYVKYVCKEDGIFDIEFDLACNEFDRYMVNESENLIKEQQVKSPDYMVEQNEPDKQAEKMTEERFRDYLKCANDLVKDLTNTKSIFSSDTKYFKDLLQSAKNFKDTVVKNRENDIADLKDSLTALKDAASAYKDHLNNDISTTESKWSKRQTRREKICQTIAALSESVERNPTEPKKAFETEYANKMLEEYCKKKNINVSEEKLSGNFEKLVKHRAFRQIVDKMSISKMHNADEAMVGASLKEFEKITKGYARDRGYNLERMEKEKTSSVSIS